MSDKELREALERIRDTTLDQPAAVNVPQEEWFRRLLLDAMGIARRALDASPDPSPDRERLDTERLAVIGAARQLLRAHDHIVTSRVVDRDSTFAMKNAADNLRAVLGEYDRAASGEPSTPEEPR